MADHRSHHPQTTDDPKKTHFSDKGHGPSTSKILAAITLFPIGAILLLLAGITLTGTVIGLAIATPLFVIFSPVLIPAGLVIVLAVTGFLTSGVFGVTALSSISWIVKYIRRMRDTMHVPENLEYAKKRAKETAGQLGQRTREGAQEAVGYVGQKSKEAGQMVQSKAQEGGKTHAPSA